MSPRGVFVAGEEINICVLDRREHIVVKRRARHRTVIPALRRKVCRDLLCLEDAAVARVDLIARKTALLPRKARHIRLREPARGAVRQDIAARGRLRRGRRGRGWRCARRRRGGGLRRGCHDRRHCGDRVLRLGLDVERDEQHDQRHAERGKDRNEQRLAARRVRIPRWLVRRIVLPAGYRRVVGPRVVGRRICLVIPVADRNVLVLPAIRRRGLVRRRLLRPAVGAPDRIVRDVSSAVGTLHWLHLPFPTRFCFPQYTMVYILPQDKKCPPVLPGDKLRPVNLRCAWRPRSFSGSSSSSGR